MYVYTQVHLSVCAFVWGAGRVVAFVRQIDVQTYPWLGPGVNMEPAGQDISPSISSIIQRTLQQSARVVGG